MSYEDDNSKSYKKANTNKEGDIISDNIGSVQIEAEKQYSIPWPKFVQEEYAWEIGLIEQEAQKLVTEGQGQIDLESALRKIGNQNSVFDPKIDPSKQRFTPEYMLDRQPLSVVIGYIMNAYAKNPVKTSEMLQMFGDQNINDFGSPAARELIKKLEENKIYAHPSNSNYFQDFFLEMRGLVRVQSETYEQRMKEKKEKMRGKEMAEEKKSGEIAEKQKQPEQTLTRKTILATPVAPDATLRIPVAKTEKLPDFKFPAWFAQIDPETVAFVERKIQTLGFDEVKNNIHKKELAGEFESKYRRKFDFEPINKMMLDHKYLNVAYERFLESSAGIWPITRDNLTQAEAYLKLREPELGDLMTRDWFRDLIRKRVADLREEIQREQLVLKKEQEASKYSPEIKRFLDFANSFYDLKQESHDNPKYLEFIKQFKSPNFPYKFYSHGDASSQLRDITNFEYDFFESEKEPDGSIKDISYIGMFENQTEELMVIPFSVDFFKVGKAMDMLVRLLITRNGRSPSLQKGDLRFFNRILNPIKLKKLGNGKYELASLGRMDMTFE